MNRTNIEWTNGGNGEQGYTWNPITGCLHNCEYCYARKITERFHTHYPFGFQPTFYPDRLQDKPPRKPSKIFVGSMGDLFGDWPWNKSGDWPVSTNYIVSKILGYCAKHPQHTFIFLTKNPQGMIGYDFPENCWTGVTVTGPDGMNRLYHLVDVKSKVKFVSFEPLIESLESFYFKGKDLMEEIDWSIVGAMTGDKKIIPPKKDFEWLIESLGSYNIPIFIKGNALKVYPELPQLQQYPKGA